MATPDEIIEANLAKPKRGLVDGQEFEQHSIPDQIKGAKFLANKNIGQQKFLGLMFRTFQPPGTA